MAFRFWRRIRIAPGITLNLSKSGASVSIGPRGAKVTIGPRGSRATVGIPGSGLFYTVRGSGKGRRRKAGPRRRQAAPAPAADPLDLGFFRRLVTPAAEEALVDGLRELTRGNEDAALARLDQAPELPDAAFLAGFLHLKRLEFDAAESRLLIAARAHRQLGRVIDRYGVQARLYLPVTGELMAAVEPNLRGALLGLVEVYQHQGRSGEALETLERLRRLEPDDPVVRVSLAELLLETRPGDRDACRRVLRLSEDVENASPVHAALLLYRARALRCLGLAEAARQTLTRTLRRRKGRDPELLRALRYERALALHELGRERDARRDLERIYAEDPHYEDVAALLGVETGD